MVSLGPGDIDLLTIKALEVLKSSDIICIPTKSSNNSFDKSLTYQIVKALMLKHNFKVRITPVFTPMYFRKKDWQYQVDTIINKFKTNYKVSFVTLGDSAVYSTVYYLLDIIKVQNELLYKNCEVIAGVTSFSNASAKVKKPLCIGNSSFSVIPLLNKKIPNTTVYMRPKIGSNTQNIRQSGDLYTFENLNYENEKITNNKVHKINKYMTLFIDFFE
jgi:precorrin-2/cobalt-factor-2 C20-methyltransferase